MTTLIPTALSALGGSASRRAIAAHLGVRHDTVAFARLVDAAIAAGEVVAVGAGPKARLVLPDVAAALASAEAEAERMRAVVWATTPKEGA